MSPNYTKAEQDLGEYRDQLNEMILNGELSLEMMAFILSGTSHLELNYKAFQKNSGPRIYQLLVEDLAKGRLRAWDVMSLLKWIESKAEAQKLVSQKALLQLQQLLTTGEVSSWRIREAVKDAIGKQSRSTIQSRIEKAALEYFKKHPGARPVDFRNSLEYEAAAGKAKVSDRLFKEYVKHVPFNRKGGRPRLA